jgi:hypothetical protein
MMDSNDLRLLGLIMEQHLQPSVLGDQHKLTSNGERKGIALSGACVDVGNRLSVAYTSSSTS